MTNKSGLLVGAGSGKYILCCATMVGSELANTNTIARVWKFMDRKKKKNKGPSHAGRSVCPLIIFIIVNLSNHQAQAFVIHLILTDSEI